MNENQLNEIIKELEEFILDHKKNIEVLKECHKNIDVLMDLTECMLEINEKLTATNDIDKKTNEIDKNTNLEEYYRIRETFTSDYDYIQRLVKDVSDVVYDDFEIMTWSASIGINHKHIYTSSSYPKQSAKYICYVLKYNFFETAREFLVHKQLNNIEHVATKALEQSRFRELIDELMNKLKDAGFLIYCHIDTHHGLSCGDTYNIEIWRNEYERESY